MCGYSTHRVCLYNGIAMTTRASERVRVTNYCSSNQYLTLFSFIQHFKKKLFINNPVIHLFWILKDLHQFNVSSRSLWISVKFGTILVHLLDCQSLDYF